jgi:hypothetical protein
MNNTINPEEVTQFKLLVKKWLEVDNQLDNLSKQSKELRSAKKDLSNKISVFMVHNKISDINTEMGIVKCNEKKVKTPLNKDNIKTNLSEMINNELQVNQILNKIMEGRELKTTYEIKRIKAKN